MLRVPSGTTHWFTLCEDKRICAIRWFQDTTGWTPHYTGSGVDQGYQPLCFGPAYLGPRAATSISA
jgi:1,2-dihydroxy-3-keto-5-methylthiopentene dioxygenase